jgi:hypothetical protein
LAVVKEVAVAEELMGKGEAGGEEDDGSGGEGGGGGGGVAAPQISPAHKETLNVCERARMHSLSVITSVPPPLHKKHASHLHT